MASVNKAILVGNIGKDPDVRVSQYGKKVAMFYVATNENWLDKETNTKKEKVEWHKIVVHNENLAIFTQNFLKKGTKVYIEGKICSKKWTDKNGNEHIGSEIVLSNYGGKIVIVSGERNSNHVGGEELKPQENKTLAQVKDDDPYGDIDFPFD